MRVTDPAQRLRLTTKASGAVEPSRPNPSTPKCLPSPGPGPAQSRRTPPGPSRTPSAFKPQGPLSACPSPEY